MNVEVVKGKCTNACNSPLSVTILKTKMHQWVDEG